jgi:hypothetical protein
LLGHRKDIFLLDEAHFQVQLVKLARRTVRPGILVPETRRNLEVPVEPGDHKELLELLRRLRKREKFAGMQPGRHEEVACAFGAGTGEDRRLELVESQSSQLLTQ